MSKYGLLSCGLHASVQDKQIYVFITPQMISRKKTKAKGTGVTEHTDAGSCLGRKVGEDISE